MADGADLQRPVFYFDLGSPYAYLAAERIHEVFDEPPEWQPILLGGLFRHFDRDSWANGPDREQQLQEVERRAASYGLPPIVWPEPFPPANTLTAMRAAAYAKQIGKTVTFSLAAFRQAFAAGRDLSEEDTVLIAAAACELHPRALQSGISTDSLKARLREATDEAAGLGVRGVPSVVVGDRVFWGDDRLEEAAEAARAH